MTQIYRSKYGREQFSFCFQQQMDGRWQGYLLVQCEVNASPKEIAKSLPREASRKGSYIPFPEPAESFEAARDLAAFWADAIEKYRRQPSRYRRRKSYWVGVSNVTETDFNNQFSVTEQGSPARATRARGVLPGSSPHPHR